MAGRCGSWTTSDRCGDLGADLGRACARVPDRAGATALGAALDRRLRAGAGEYGGSNREYGAILTYSLNVPGLRLQDDEKERARKESERVAKAAKAEPAAKDVKDAKDAKDAKDEGPGEKVDITVADAAGKVIRKFKGPAKLGVNRAVWDLGTDPFRNLPEGDNSRNAGDDEPSGPEVVPGTYTVTVKLGDHVATQTIQVVADPRTRNTAADWAARGAAIDELRSLNDTMADAIWRLRRTRDDVSAVQTKAKQIAQDAGEKDAKKLGELPLVKDGGKVSDALDEIEKRLWQAPEGIGIRPNTDALSSVFTASDVQSSWDPPTANDRAKLVDAHRAVDAVVAELNKLFAGDVAAFRKKAEEAKIGLLSGAQPVVVPAVH